MRRGDICVIDLDPARGTEARKSRPAVIVSNDGANTTATRLGRGVLTVVPVTSNLERVYPFQVLLPANDTGLARNGAPSGQDSDETKRRVVAGGQPTSGRR